MIQNAILKGLAVFGGLASQASQAQSQKEMAGLQKERLDLQKREVAAKESQAASKEASRAAFAKEKEAKAQFYSGKASANKQALIALKKAQKRAETKQEQKRIIRDIMKIGGAE